ncbi:hypothetical protein [Bacillus cereus group sp. IBL03679]|uniref:hypothetical protein n=1 Tax=Bacillus cereus group sp. IBL03679 TaxID=3240095 RepID=UPI003D2F6991
MLSSLKNWIRKESDRYQAIKEANQKRFQNKLDKKAGFSNAMLNPLYNGTEIIMKNGSILQMEAIEIVFIDTNTIKVTKGRKHKTLLGTKKYSSTTKRKTFRKNGQDHFVDQIASIRKYSPKEQPKYIVNPSLL